MATAISSRVKTHNTPMGKATRRYVNTVEVFATQPALHESEFVNFLTDSDTSAIDEWVNENQIGTRTSFDTWKLNSQEAVTMFLLKWNE